MQHEKFAPAFLDIATGQIGCSQNQCKKAHQIGGEMTYWLMIILGAWGVVAEPNTNNRRALITKHTPDAAKELLNSVHQTILGDKL